MHAVIALATKDLLLLLRDRTGLLFTFGVPVLFAVFFGTLWSSDNEGTAMPIAVVDEDESRQSAALVAKLSRASELAVTALSRDEATESVRLGDLVALVVIPQGFGAAQERLFFGDPPRLELGVDPARRAEAGMLEGILTRYAVETLTDMLSDPQRTRDLVADMRTRVAQDRQNPVGNLLLGRFFDNLDGFLGALDGVLEVEARSAAEGQPGSEDDEGGDFRLTPVQIESVSVVVDDDGPGGAYDISFPQGIVWGLIACIASFATALVTERTRGTLIRLRLAPISRWHILGGVAVACFLTSMAVMAVLLGLGVLVFGIRPDSWVLLVVSVVSVAAAFVGVMLLLSTVGKTERAVSSVSWMVMMVMAMFGGGMIPLFFMPEWMSGVSHFSPVKWAVLALEGGLWRGLSAAEMGLPCGMLIGIGAACFGAGLIRLRHGTLSG